MVRVLQLPYGPWKSVLTGVWIDKQVAYYENPDKKVLISIFDRRGEDIKGILMMLTKFFVVKGDSSNMADTLKRNITLIEKHSPTFKANYLAVSTTPQYVSFEPGKIIDTTQALYEELEGESAAVVNMSTKYGITLTELKYAEEKYVKRLLGDPLVIPSIVVRKPSADGVSVSTKEGKVKLGLKKDSSLATELISSFALTLITGGEEIMRRHTAHVIMEDCVLNGISGVLFDTGNNYAKLDTPNPDTSQYERYKMNVEPIGMPVRKFKPGDDIFIDLTLLDKGLFADVAGTGADSAEGELIGKVLEQHRIKNLKELEESIMKIAGEENKYYAARAVRIAKLLGNRYPKTFDGQIDPKEVVAPWLKRMGRVAVIDMKGFDKDTVKGIIYTVLKTLYEHYRKEQAGSETKVFMVIEIEDIAYEASSRLDREIRHLAKAVNDYGVAVCMTPSKDADISKELKQEATMKIQMLNANEAAASERTGRPYKVYIRPSLSGM